MHGETVVMISGLVAVPCLGGASFAIWLSKQAAFSAEEAWLKTLGMSVAWAGLAASLGLALYFETAMPFRSAVNLFCIACAVMAGLEGWKLAAAK